MSRTRREFLQSCCAFGAAGATAQLGRFGMMTAHAQGLPDYRALVCLFQFGGNDSNNMIVPTDGRYASYQTMRTSLALPGNTLLPAGASGLGFHPRLTNVARLYRDNAVATVLNVGTLARPTTKATLNSVPLPRNLYSHSDQTQQWQSSDPTGGVTGWGGRVNDIMISANTGVVPPGFVLNGGNALFLSAPNTQGVNVSSDATFGLTDFGSQEETIARVQSMQRLLTFDTGVKLVTAANGVLGQSLRIGADIDAALQGAPALPVAFPNSFLGSQLAQVAQIIAVRGSLGATRQIFFAGTGGYDNHENLLQNHDELMTELDAAIGAFIQTLEIRGVADKVTLFTESEFNRTGDVNERAGTDHAWGGHQLVIGRAVTPGPVGTLPVLQLRGPDDADDRGYWIPSQSLDQYAATLASWFGVNNTDLQTIFPNLRFFNPINLGFV